MITLLFLLFMALILLGVLAVGGVGFFIVFGDVIVCILIIVWIIKKLFFKKKQYQGFGPFTFRNSYKLYYEEIRRRNDL